MFDGRSYAVAQTRADVYVYCSEVVGKYGEVDDLCNWPKAEVVLELGVNNEKKEQTFFVLRIWFEQRVSLRYIYFINKRVDEYVQYHFM